MTQKDSTYAVSIIYCRWYDHLYTIEVNWSCVYHVTYPETVFKRRSVRLRRFENERCGNRTCPRGESNTRFFTFDPVFQIRRAETRDCEMKLLALMKCCSAGALCAGSQAGGWRHIYGKASLSNSTLPVILSSGRWLWYQNNNEGGKRKKKKKRERHFLILDASKVRSC